MNWLESLDDQMNIACLSIFRLHSERFNRVWFLVRVLGGKNILRGELVCANSFKFLCLFQAGKKLQSPQIHKDLNISQISGKPLYLDTTRVRYALDLQNRGSVPSRGYKFCSFPQQPDRLWSPHNIVHQGCKADRHQASKIKTVWSSPCAFIT